MSLVRHALSAAGFGLFLISISLAVAGCSEVGKPADTENACAVVPCRPAAPNDGSALSVLRPSPYVFNDVVTIVPGESFFVTGRIHKGRLIDLSYRERASAGDDTLGFQFERSDLGMILQVKNLFPQTVKFHAMLQLGRDPALHRTSSCPVAPAGQSMEMWPHLITMIVLADFRVVPSQGAHVCEW